MPLVVRGHALLRGVLQGPSQHGVDLWAVHQNDLFLAQVRAPDEARLRVLGHGLHPLDLDLFFGFGDGVLLAPLLKSTEAAIRILTCRRLIYPLLTKSQPRQLRRLTRSSSSRLLADSPPALLEQVAFFLLLLFITDWIHADLGEALEYLLLHLLNYTTALLLALHALNLLL